MRCLFFPETTPNVWWLRWFIIGCITIVELNRIYCDKLSESTTKIKDCRTHLRIVRNCSWMQPNKHIISKVWDECPRLRKYHPKRSIWSATCFVPGNKIQPDRSWFKHFSELLNNCIPCAVNKKNYSCRTENNRFPCWDSSKPHAEKKVNNAVCPESSQLSSCGAKNGIQSKRKRQKNPSLWKKYQNS